ncbi:hypothetical protein GCM10028775_14210 [Catellatospora paridis]
MAIGIIVAAALTAGCTGTPPTPPTASASPSAAPAGVDQLTAAVDGLRKGTASYTAAMSGDLAITGTGRFDGVSGDISSTTTVVVAGKENSVELIRIGNARLSRLLVPVGHPVVLASSGEALELPVVHIADPLPAGLG